ncbi:MAG: glycoside hydrolase family 13 protein, partial [Butyricicoccus sp.]
LESLHVTTIYFNPIFQAYSNHRYDTGDYKRIDPLLGCEEDFRALCSEAARRGMRVVLDGVFNHTGYDSRYFNARGHYDSVGAFQSKESPYFSWFDFHNWPNEYGSWWGIYTLPQVNESDGSYQDYIIEDEDSVVRRWLRLGASGWRLDVADELPDSFIQKLNAAARREKSDALIIGEVWEDASNKIAYSERRRYFQGGELDSVMNYPLRDAILGFLNGGTAEHFAESMECIRENYPRDVFYNLMNVVGTHDTARALTLLGVTENEWKMDRNGRAHYQLPPDRLEALRRLRMAAVISSLCRVLRPFTTVMRPVSRAFEDPFSRRTTRGDTKTRSCWRSTAGCAKSVPRQTLADGDRSSAAAGALLRYERTSGDSRLVIVVSRGYHGNKN